ncbi:hypothetical protein O6H91_06G118400 [Diphasiastrum complanatum]|uniref:Uncharacterized protein n=1 Tax=Diphasiastrum complanatum TaxID=34168 RepID=A0ACC2DI04_DIPCM|nr:hypothetical protein O6H91_06G118400 [Diphasiastrum complanatum]
MKMRNMFWKKKTSSSFVKDDSSPSSSPYSGSQTSSPQSKLFSPKSLVNGNEYSPLHSPLTASKPAPSPYSRPTEAFPDSPIFSADESGMTSDKSSEHSSEFRELVEVFRFYDSNGDGKISTSELGSVLKMLGDNATEEDLRMMVKEVDFNGDGFIDLSEFIKLHTFKSGDEAKSEELKAAFHVFDVDKNGLITAEELHSVLKGLGNKGLTMEDCNKMIRGVDRDGDGYVSFDEFKRMMRSNF